MQRFVTEFDYTHEEIGALLGISRSNVSNILRLLRLDGRVQHWLGSGSLSEGHGKLLAGISYDKQYEFAYKAIKKGWSVNILDEAMKQSKTKQTGKVHASCRRMNPSVFLYNLDVG